MSAAPTSDRAAGGGAGGGAEREAERAAECARKPILIAGPTASGKSALALRLAERLGGAVINADTMQVYAEWRVLTARPSREDAARAPHLLYGHVPVSAPYSTGAWLREAAAALETCRREGWRPIFAGGSGLLFTALTEGLAELPPVRPETRAAATARLEALGRERFAAALAARDPATAAAIDLANPMRLLRAWETLEETGEGLAAHWARTAPPLLPAETCATRLLVPDRERLRTRIADRFDAMLAEGALEETAAAMALDPPPTAQAWMAHGARALAAHLRGEISLEAARETAVLDTRRYAKRQATWARGRMGAWRARPV
ncbi:tRNA (adenosine(37)-N6)-dimethylallyltransferase MiaA [Rubrimonas cliftonensis]|uniref:tRNA dimethylallyltransferase n=1 Tax=Rubrimonas cliftonensis TaxID=89524 RepID=A0A1H4AFH6_9RHOB|nr:tRNA (adenosine(37)-N6)-dimethylallyltransferase MiaA [Rubrimonas cliftonensis]SEA34626.1 tRNA dimethylallyltransferase [Rubrimonas cliftonensis]